jgi:hypothetical protein
MLNTGTVAPVYIGGLEKHTSDLRVPATPAVFTLERACSQPVPINALKMTDIHHLVSYIPDEHKNIYYEILAWLYITGTLIMITGKINSKVCFKYSDIVAFIGL